MSKQIGFMRVQLICQSSYGLLSGKTILALLSIYLLSCDAQTSPSKDEAERVKTDISAEDPTSIQMSNGSSLVLPAGAAPEGSEVRLQSTSTLPVFDSLGTAEISPGSLAINVSVYNSSGERLSELEQPMLVGLPIQAASLLLVENSEANLCAFLSALDKSLLVWRAANIKVVKNKAQFLTTKLGKFQLAYCGDTALSGFSEVEDEKLTSVDNWEITHNIDAATGAAKEKDLELSYEIPAAYLSGANSLCVFMLSAKEKSGGEDFEPVAMLASGAFTVKSGAAANIKLPFASSNLDHDGVFLGIAMLGKGKSCSWTSIVDIEVLFESQDEYLSYYVFHLSNDEVKAENISSMGKGLRSYSSITLKMGFDQQAGTAAPTVSSEFPKGVASCVVTGSNSENKFLSAASFNILLDPLEIDGETSASYFLSTPSNLKVKSGLEVYVGMTCLDIEKDAKRAELPGDGAKSYIIKFDNVVKNATYRLVPNSILLVEAAASPSRCLSISQSTASVRYKIASNDVTSGAISPILQYLFLPSLESTSSETTYKADLYPGCTLDAFSGTILGSKEVSAAYAQILQLDFRN
ncbi:MAG: hypothetical protein KBD78_04340 [Oligoflexales bacterium]|nr:hypothetical protein [Oligoflexales bacterium]